MYKNKTVAAIINCAGCSIRFGKNKLTTKIGNDYTIVKTIKNFLLPEIDELIVTVSEKYFNEYEEILLKTEKLPVKLVLGDSERYLSALKGIKSCSSEIAMLHDGVRPFVSKKMISDLLAATVENKAAILAVPVAATTIKMVDENHVITKSLRRNESWLAQTPQAFEKTLIETAYEKALAGGFQIVSDDSEVVSDFTDVKVKAVLGEETNIKITFPLDLEIANIIDKDWKAE